MTEQHDIYTWGELYNHVVEWNKNNYPGHPIEFYAGTKWIESSIRNIENIHARLPNLQHLAFGYRPVPFPEVSEPEKVWIKAYMQTNIHGEKVITPGTDIDNGVWRLFAEDCTIVDSPLHWVPQSWEEMIWAANNNACRIEYSCEQGGEWAADPCVAADYENYRLSGVRFVDGSYSEYGDTYHHRVSGPRPPKGK